MFFRYARFTLLLCAFLGGRLQAVDLSVLGGASFGNAVVTPAPPYPANIGFATSGGLAFGGGALLGIELVPTLLDLEVGAIYLPRRSTLVASGSALTSTISADELMPTFQVPILLRVGILGMISVGGGVYYWWGTGQVTQTTGGTTVPHTWTDAGYASHDYGFAASVAMVMPIAPMFSLRVDGRFLFGMTNISNTAGITYETRDIELLAGIQLRL